MTSSADKFDKKMKKLIKADWTAKEVAAVLARLYATHGLFGKRALKANL